MVIMIMGRKNCEIALAIEHQKPLAIETETVGQRSCSGHWLPVNQMYFSLRRIYTHPLRHSTAMRTAMLTAEKAKANEVAERMSIPMSLLGVIFLAILVTPALMRVMGGAT